MSKQVFEGKVQIYQDYEDGPSVLVDGRRLVDCFSDDYLDKGYNDKVLPEWRWDAPDSDEVPGKWRITIERLDE